ncbi:transposase [Bradyrhizobium sp. i1.15.2]
MGMEACSGSQWLARKIAAMGHTVRIIPAQFVKPYVKSNKNDIIDAAAIRSRDETNDALRRAKVA